MTAYPVKQCPGLQVLSRTALICWGLLSAMGCSLIRQPVPPPLPAEQVTQSVRTQTRALRTLKDTDVSLVITAAVNGKTKRLPSLGGFIVFDAELPGLWLEAEKLSRPIFSLKALGHRFWLALYSTCEVATGGPSAYAKLPHLVRPEEVRGFLASPEWLGLTWPSTNMAVEADSYRFDVHVLGVLSRQVWVDRRKVVVTAIRRYDALGRAVTGIRLLNHKPADDALFPHRLIVERPLSGVKVDLRLGSPTINEDLPAAAFRPPERPGWRTIDLDHEPLSAVKAFRTGE